MRNFLPILFFARLRRAIFAPFVFGAPAVRNFPPIFLARLRRAKIPPFLAHPGRVIFGRQRRAISRPLCFLRACGAQFPLHFVLVRLRHANVPPFLGAPAARKSPPIYLARLWRAIFPPFVFLRAFGARFYRHLFCCACGAQFFRHVLDAPAARKSPPIFLAYLRRAIFARLRRAISSLFCFLRAPGAQFSRHYILVRIRRAIFPHFLRACGAQFPPILFSRVQRAIFFEFVLAHFCAPAACNFVPIVLGRLDLPGCPQAAKRRYGLRRA